jgi:hypothetical protein
LLSHVPMGRRPAFAAKNEVWTASSVGHLQAGHTADGQREHRPGDVAVRFASHGRQRLAVVPRLVRRRVLLEERGDAQTQSRTCPPRSRASEEEAGSARPRSVAAHIAVDGRRWPVVAAWASAASVRHRSHSDTGRQKSTLSRRPNTIALATGASPGWSTCKSGVRWHPGAIRKL